MERLSELIDKRVTNIRGDVVGSVDEILISCSSGRVAGVIVARDDRSRFRVDWPDLAFRDGRFVLQGQVIS